MDASTESSVHRKRMAQILRYIANMHQTMSNGMDNSKSSFVQNSPPEADFFQSHDGGNDNNGVLFSINDFRQLIQRTSDNPFFTSPPFSFYAAPASEKARKRTLAGALKSTFTSSSSESELREKACWLRITRLTNTQILMQPEIPNNQAHQSALQTYLDDWKKLAHVDHMKSLLTIDHLKNAPKPPPTLSSRDSATIKKFLDKYLVHLRTKAYQTTLEPIYNALFEWTQLHQDHNQELVWGLGHAHVERNGLYVSGPLLEVMVEVELASDGALLVRPREHTGVSLYRPVVTAIANMFDSHAMLSQLHRTVAEMDCFVLSPGQPETYAYILKRMAVELAPTGSFRSSSTGDTKLLSRQDQLTVSENWCLFARSKPSSVWARDATAFADKMLLPNAPQLPLATWSLTHGPGAFEDRFEAHHLPPKPSGMFGWFYSTISPIQSEVKPQERPLFPLPTSDAQDQIADLLMNKKYPACVVEGPPGSGKTHSIANIMCAYLCQGKRVLATSKNAPALSVLRERLPPSVRDLCVDVSTSELTGMRQLQQTVERLANRVSCANVSVEMEKCALLKRSIARLKKEVLDIDAQIAMHSQHVRLLIGRRDGGDLVQLSQEMLDEAPWMMRVISKWQLQEFVALHKLVSDLILPESDPILTVDGFPLSPTSALVQLASSKTGKTFSSISLIAKGNIASIPFVGILTGMGKHLQQLERELSHITIDGVKPTSTEEWMTVARALEHYRVVSRFTKRYWKPRVQQEGWPTINFSSQSAVRSTEAQLRQAVKIKRLALQLRIDDHVLIMVNCRALDVQRSRLAQQIQHLAEELVDATVVSALSRSFTPNAQSALVKFAQIAGKAKFNRSSQPSNMTQRQRRRRQEYLDAFNQCCRYIPCWILTTSQISDYLPPEECLFDLVIVDESSQSDVTVLPGLLRGKQWLIVGDGKCRRPNVSYPRTH
ncbi:hypothetical protein MPSEU_000877400 [Mayamaea pseudoterrestris]|nr:hypothetical protein MPSEU_000877400 [Mayamaea pseudoterrestris]